LRSVARPLRRTEVDADDQVDLGSASSRPAKLLINAADC
jgi:hypothetical protein